LHVAAFVTLFEAYMGIEPHFHLWNDFFHVRFQWDSGAKVAVWGYVEVYIWTGGEVDPYFQLSMSNPPVGCQRQWFFLKNDIDAPLPRVTGRHLAA
jgi:hypothetical protein